MNKEMIDRINAALNEISDKEIRDLLSNYIPILMMLGSNTHWEFNQQQRIEEDS